jgi:hypothetical protein
MSAYKKLRIKFLTDRMCEAKIYNCTLKATDVHHKKGRIGDNMLDTTHWLAVCRSCHNWIENNPEESKELGFSTNRLE